MFSVLAKPGQQVIQAKRTSFQQYRYTQQLKARPPAAKISIDTLGDTKDDNAGNNAQNKVGVNLQLQRSVLILWVIQRMTLQEKMLRIR